MIKLESENIAVISMAKYEELTTIRDIAKSGDRYIVVYKYYEDQNIVSRSKDEVIAEYDNALKGLRISLSKAEAVNRDLEQALVRQLHEIRRLENRSLIQRILNK